MPYSDVISWLSNVFTIIGVFIAVWIYCFWKKDYKTQQAHTYALDLLKKMKCLHLEIELLRRPKFHYAKTLIKDIENKYIPQIEERILAKLIEIQVDLLVAGTVLIKHKNLQSKFNFSIGKNIINKINIAVHMFYSESQSSSFNVKSCELFAIIFPSEVKIEKWEVKRSILGTEIEIIDDEFNKIIENDFESIYSDLEDNLVGWSKIMKWIKRKLFCCS